MTMLIDHILPPRILVVDDERQIHASLRLRLGKTYELVSCSEPREALSHVRQESFDLCIVDVHMPGMTGLEFVEEARQIDSGLGFVFLSGHATEENLRRAIPLQVYDFLLKPLPDRAGFEQQLPDWIQRTKSRRRELALVEKSGVLVQRLDAAQIERDIEFTASESARDALMQSANLLTTIHALLASACHTLDGRERDAALSPVIRSLQEARKAAEAATVVTESFFNSAYANRDDSPALMGPGLAHSLNICLRWARAEQDRKHVETAVRENNAVIRDICGIELLLLLIPAIGAAIEMAPPGTTITIRSEGLERVDAASKELRSRDFMWVNRRNAAHSEAGVWLGMRSSGTPLTQSEIKNWLEGAESARIKIPARGLLHGLGKCRGMMGLSVAPTHGHFELVLALPT